MASNDDEWKTKLSEEPLTKNGFDQQLQSRIEQKLEEQASGSGKWAARWKIAAGAAAVFALLFSAHALMTADSQRDIVSGGEAIRQIPDPAAVQVKYDDASNMTVNSAFLIGLRTDYPADDFQESNSSYRTLLIAPEDGKLEKIVEGSGILMPYKQDFWMVSPQWVVDAGRSGQLLTAVKAKEPQKLFSYGKLSESSGSLVKEKLLFIGNRYLAVSQQFRQLDNESQTNEYVWVKELEQIVASRRSLPVVPGREPHVSLSSVNGAGAEVASVQKEGWIPIGESWTISRNPGRWIARQAEYGIAEGGGVQSYALQEVPSILPESVVNHDKLALDWADIQSLRPYAEDAFSSPNEDMLVIVEEGQLLAYPYREGTVGTPPLVVPLEDDETVVMAQWALDPHVDRWKKQVSEHLQAY